MVGNGIVTDDELKAAPINVEQMMKCAMWMIESHKPNFEQPEPFVVLHPDELASIEEKWGSVDKWWKEYVCSGDIWRELFDD